MPAVPKLRVQLLSPEQAANLLGVNVRTIQAWIDKDAIPYVELPGTGRGSSYRIPLQGLLSSLGGTYGLSADPGVPAPPDLADERSD